MKYSKKIIENTIRHWEKMLNEDRARTYDELFDQLMDAAVQMDDIPNWMKIPEFASEMRGFIDRAKPANKAMTPDYYITVLHKQIYNRLICKYDADLLGVQRPLPVEKKIPFIFNAATKDWPSFRRLDPGFEENTFLSFPLYYCRFVFFAKLDEELIKKYRDAGGVRFAPHSNDIMFEISNLNSIDVVKACLPGTNEILAIDENGVIS